MRDKKKRTLTKSGALRLLAFTLTAVAVIAAYYPSLFHPPRADQIVYLAETSTRQDPADLIFGCYDLTRNRVFSPGDSLTFRPLLYMILGSEQVLFGHRFWAWQSFAVLCHLLVIWCLLKLLWKINGPLLAFAVVWAFALSRVNYEQVTWSHLTSYLLMTACVIKSLELYFLSLKAKHLSLRTAFTITLLLLIACFIYETANLFALCLLTALIAARPRYWHRAFILGVPVIIYGLTSVYNLVIVNHIPLIPAESSSLSVTTVAINSVKAILWWSYVGIFHGLYGYVLSSRTMFFSGDVLRFKPLWQNNLSVFTGLIFISAFCGLACHRLKRLSRPALFCFGLVMSMLFIYVGVIAAGRQQRVDFLQLVRVNTYYQYFFWVLATIAGSLLIGQPKNTGSLRILRFIFIFVCLASGSLQGFRIFQESEAFRIETQPQIVLTRTLDLLIAQKGQVPGFSFYVHPDYPGNYTLRNIKTPAHVTFKENTFINFLYIPYLGTREAARYKLLITED